MRVPDVKIFTYRGKLGLVTPVCQIMHNAMHQSERCGVLVPHADTVHLPTSKKPDQWRGLPVPLVPFWMQLISNCGRGGYVGAAVTGISDL